MSGYKLAVGAPLADTQIKSAVKSGDKTVSFVLCSSQHRIAELREFYQEMIAFTTQAVGILSVDQKIEKEDLIEKLSGKDLNKKNKIVLLTPIDFKRLFACFSEFKVHWVVIDKIDMHLSLDLKDDLLEVSELLEDIPRSKFIISTNTKDKLDEESKEIRQAFTKGEKALVIRLNEEIK